MTTEAIDANFGPRIAAWEEEARSALSSTPGASPIAVRCYETVDSTMDVAREYCRSDVSGAPLLCLAREQRAGRGRQGRRWSAPEGSLAMTFVLHGTLPLSRLGGLSLAVGVAVARAVEKFGAATRLKWPNDVQSPEGKKLAGILIETVPGTTGTWILVGIGMNLLETPPDVPHSVSLLELCGGRLAPAEAAGALACDLSLMWRSYEEHGFSALREEWLRRSSMIGKTVEVDLGARIVSGACRGIDAQGALLLETSGGVESVSAGHILSIR